MSIQLIQQYYAKVEQMIRYGGTRNESTLGKCFQDLLEQYARAKNLVLVPEMEYILPTDGVTLLASNHNGGGGKPPCSLGRLLRLAIILSVSKIALFQAAMQKKRMKNPNEKHPVNAQARPPVCPKCGALMVLRTAKRGNTPGQQFYGCPNYPRCRVVIPLQSLAPAMSAEIMEM
jgi:hypothetical protein